MSEPPSDQAVDAPGYRPSLDHLFASKPLRPSIGILLCVSGLALAGWLLLGGDGLHQAWALAIGLALGAILAGCWGAAHRYRTWTLPMRRLLDLTRRAREGEIPIDCLDDFDGGPRPIVPAIQELLREVRTQRMAIAELEAEMRQKVANRTDALERTIGSLRQQATRDVLTGLFNRRFLDEFLGPCVQRHVKGHKDLCVLMIDVDHFKILNDTLGHAAGDDLLRAVGQLIRSAIRGEDVGFRCGGDEFVVLLPESSLDAGRALAERLTALVDALVKTLRVPRLPRLSVGLTTLRACSPATAEALLTGADRALYEVKKARKSLREWSHEGLNAAARGVQSSPLSRTAG